MRDVAKEMLEKLAIADWFAEVGKQNVENAIVISSWREAIEKCTSHWWKEFTLEAQNQISIFLVNNNRERFRQWNNVTQEIKHISIPMVQKKIGEIVKENQLPKSFVDRVQWDILFIVVEAEYSDIIEPGLYDQLAKWYLAGRFPCGWQGEFPKGQIVIF